MKRLTYETFLALAKLYNFRKTAEQLNTTQSNVSARIKALEEDLGGSLFVRSPQAVTLTPLGRELVPFAEDILRSMDRFAHAAGMNPDQEGTLRLALSETMVSTLLPAFIREFSAFYPRADVEISVDSTTNQRQQLIDRAVDLAFLMGPVSEYEVTNLPLLNLPMIWVVAADHPLASRGRIGIEDLAASPVLSYARNSRPFVELREALTNAGIRSPRLFSSNALSASIGMTKAGLGICTLPDVVARPHIESGDVVRMDADIPLNDLRFTASFLNNTASGLAKSAATMAARIANDLEI